MLGLQIVVEIKRMKVKRSVVGPRRRLRGARVQFGGRVRGGRVWGQGTDRRCDGGL